jgi:iron uptake system component EfeO
VLPLARPALAAAVLAGTVAVLAGCSSSSPSSPAADNGATAVTVTGTDTACTPASVQVPAGTVTFRLANTGSRVNELYVLRPDGSIAGERENVGPGTTGELTVELAAGSYTLQCKPGMTGDGIRATITATGGASATAAPNPRLTQAVAPYRGYVLAEARRSLAGARALAAAVKAGDVATARSLYAGSRVGWERIEPVAESFGDLDPRIDLREADLEAGQTWTGWHVVEKGLFAAGSTQALGSVADRLVADLEELVRRVPQAQISALSMASGASELLDEVSHTKVTGEEEAFSHTDLVDIQANVDGARQVVRLLEPALTATSPDLVSRLTASLAQLQGVLDTHRTSGTFRPYTAVSQPQRRALSDAVDAASEPLSRLAAAVAAA